MTPETSQNEHRPSMLPPFVAATIRGWKGRQAAVLLIAARCVLDSPVCFADTRLSVSAFASPLRMLCDTTLKSNNDSLLGAPSGSPNGER